MIMMLCRAVSGGWQEEEDIYTYWQEIVDFFTQVRFPTIVWTMNQCDKLYL